MAMIVSTYHPNRGEAWDMIAFREMGSEYYVQELMDANPQYHGIAFFEGTETLSIPYVSDAESAYQAPWRR